MADSNVLRINTKKHLMWLPMAALVLALAAQFAMYRFSMPTITLHASWAYNPRSVQEAGEKALSVVQAEVVRVERGKDIVTRLPEEPSGEDRIPTQLVTLKVLKTLKGDLKSGQTVQLFQTGGVVLPQVGPDGPKKEEASLLGARQVILEGDPLYEVGEQHLLMLDAGPDGLLKTVAPEGRFKIERDGTLTPTVDNEVTREIKGRPVAELEKLVLSR
jgi:hypothetical protein